MKQEKYIVKTFRITAEQDNFIKKWCVKNKMGESEYIRTLLQASKNKV